MPTDPSTKEMATQSRNWVRPTMATQAGTLPIISWNGFTELMSTSTTRFCFSSITPRITCTPYRNMKMKMR